MSLEAAVQAAWALDPPLRELVPAAQVFTGCAPPETARPLVVLRRRTGRRALRTSTGGVEQIELVFEIAATSYDHAAQVAAAVAGRFDDADFDAEEGFVVGMRRSEETRPRTTAEAADLTAVYEVLLYRS